MKKRRSTEAFRRLQAEWYKKLEKLGFHDIEDTESDEEVLWVWHSTYWQHRYTPDRFQAKEEYYRLAGFFLSDHSFASKGERRIWELHTEGVSLRKIAVALKIKVSRVHHTVRRLAALMLSGC